MTFEEFYTKHCIGQVAFLKEHPQIAEKVYQRCIEQDRGRDLTILKEDSASGFSWGGTIEGHEFWHFVMLSNNINLFYKKYPKIDLNQVD